MAEEQYECKKCGAWFEAEGAPDDLNCSECGSDEIERFVDVLYARDREFVQELAAGETAAKEAGPRSDQGKKE